MGTSRKETPKQVATRFDTISLKGYSPTLSKTEIMPGFPPYVRGYRTVGNIRQNPVYEPIMFWGSYEIDEIFKQEIMFLFYDISELIKATDVKKKSLFIYKKSDFESIMSHQKDIQYLYVVCIGKNYELNNLNFLNNLDKKLLDKVRFFFNFSQTSMKVIEKIRQIRALSHLFVSENNLNFYLPIVCYVNSVTEQIYSLSAHCDYIIYNAKNNQFNTSYNTFLIENSMISKTIDPFWNNDESIQF